MARKTYQGEINDKERSKQKLINAVGKVLKNKGYTGLTATNIAKTAGLSRRLITIYFDSVDVGGDQRISVCFFIANPVCQLQKPTSKLGNWLVPCRLSGYRTPAIYSGRNVLFWHWINSSLLPRLVCFQRISGYWDFIDRYKLVQEY